MGLCLAWLALGGLAHASTRTHADFDADGVLDSAVLRSTASSTQIEVRLSRSGARVFLSPAARVIALRSVDVTGDGYTDLVADSSAGLSVWVYAGHRMVPAAQATAISRTRTRTITSRVPRRTTDDNSCYDSRPPVVTPWVPATAADVRARSPLGATVTVAARVPCARTAPRAPPLA